MKRGKAMGPRCGEQREEALGAQASRGNAFGLYSELGKQLLEGIIHFTLGPSPPTVWRIGTKSARKKTE